MNTGFFDIDQILIWITRITTFLLVIPIHESAHGFIAKRLGDDTADRQGRISLNPFVHLDPFGILCMIIFGFGWAKPVPVDVSKMKKRRLGYFLVSLAGPVSNLIAAFAGALILQIIFCTAGDGETISANKEVSVAVVTVLGQFIMINIVLALFNLLPFPPLDGFNLLRSFMPASFDYWVFRNQKNISIVFFVLLFIGTRIPQVRLVCSMMVSVVYYVIMLSVSWIPMLFS